MNVNSLNSPTLFSENLSLIRRPYNDANHDTRSESGMATGAIHKSNGFHSSGLITRKNQFKRSARRSGAMMSSHQHESSMELSAQAESKFLAMSELLSSVSREASSMREFWSRIIAERDSFLQEQQELVEQITTTTRESESREVERLRYESESSERKRLIESLRTDLATALTSLSTEKKRITERDHEREHLRHELEDLRESSSRSHTDYERTRVELDTLRLTIRSVESERDNARATGGEDRHEVERLLHERTDINTRFSELTTKYEQSRREVLNLTARVKDSDVKREEDHFEISRLKEELRSSKIKIEEEYQTRIDEMISYNERLQREIQRYKDSILTFEEERDTQRHTIEQLRRDIHKGVSRYEEAEALLAKTTLKFEHAERELTNIRERIVEIESERESTQRSLDHTSEELRLIVVERDQLRESLMKSTGKDEEGRLRIVTLTETIQKTEQILVDVRTEVVTLNQRIKHIEHERDVLRHKHTDLNMELTDLRERVTALQLEIRVLTESRNKYRHDYEQSQSRCEELTEVVTTFEEDNHDFDFEIESLQVLLKEAQVQRERAIAARKSADSERDEYIQKYEEKCREMERFKVESSHHHSGSGGGARQRIVSSSRIVTRQNGRSHHNHHQSSSRESEQNGGDHSENHNDVALPITAAP